MRTSPVFEQTAEGLPNLPWSFLDDAMTWGSAAEVDGLLPGAGHGSAIHDVVPGWAHRSQALRGFQGLQGSQALTHGVVQRPGAPVPTAGGCC